MGLGPCQCCRRTTELSVITVIETVSVNRRQFECEVEYMKCHSCLSQFQTLIQFDKNYSRRVAKYHTLYNERGKLITPPKKRGRKPKAEKEQTEKVAKTETVVKPKTAQKKEKSQKMDMPHQPSLFDDDELGV